LFEGRRQPEAARRGGGAARASAHFSTEIRKSFSVVFAISFLGASLIEPHFGVEWTMPNNGQPSHTFDSIRYKTLLRKFQLWQLTL